MLTIGRGEYDCVVDAILLMLAQKPLYFGHALTVRVVLPSGTEIVSTTPAGQSQATADHGWVVAFQARLTTDQTFTVVYR